MLRVDSACHRSGSIGALGIIVIASWDFTQIESIEIEKGDWIALPTGNSNISA
jgi:hypothetical protein